MKSPNRRPPPTVKPRARLRKVPRYRSTRWLWVLFSLTGMAMLSATAGALLAVSLTSTPLMQRQLSAEEASVFAKGDRIATRMSVQLPELTRPVNILVLGTKVLSSEIDNPPPEVKNLGYQAVVNSLDGLSDTMLMVRFDPEARKLAVLSVPRDTRTDVPGYGVMKINAANSLGGPALSARSVSSLLGGVGIDRYIRINVQGIEKLVDALGGVTVYIPKDMKYQDDSQHLYINLKAGKRHLDGTQTLQLLRFRYDENGDIGRIQRQQMVMRALMEQAINPAVLPRLPKILSVIQSHIDTNLTVEELVALVGFAAQIKRSDVKMLMVPGDFSVAGEYDASYWLPNARQIQAMMAQYFAFGYGSLPVTDPGYLRIFIQDATRRADAPDSILRVLNRSGYGNVSIDDPWAEPLQVTRIVAQQGDVESAEAIRRALGVGEVRVETTGNLRSDITIQVGRDWLQKMPQARF